VLDDKTHQVICDPAKLVLVNLPGSCTHKYWTASTWKGKECKISGQIGFSQVKTIGGEEFTLDLKDIPDFKVRTSSSLLLILAPSSCSVCSKSLSLITWPLPMQLLKDGGGLPWKEEKPDGAMGTRGFENVAKAAEEPKV
jgi:hypothetical protein